MFWQERRGRELEAEAVRLEARAAELRALPAPPAAGPGPVAGDGPSGLVGAPSPVPAGGAPLPPREALREVAAEFGGIVARVLALRDRLFDAGADEQPGFRAFAGLLADPAPLADEEPGLYRELISEKEHLLRSVFPLMTRLPLLMGADAGPDPAAGAESGAMALAAIYGSALSLDFADTAALEGVLAEGRRQVFVEGADVDGVELDVWRRLGQELGEGGARTLREIVGERPVTGSAGGGVEQVMDFAGGVIEGLADVGD